MLLSKVTKIRSLLAQLPIFSFSTQPSNQLNQLNQQIIQSKTWKEFYLIFSNNKSEFNEETFNNSSRFIGHLLAKERDVVTYSEFNQIIAVISNFDVSKLTDVNIVSILACLRAFCLKGLQPYLMYKIKNKLCSRYTQLLASKPQGKENFSELIYAYYEMAYFNWQPGTRAISERILSRINSEPESNNIITLNQCTFLLHALAAKGDLSFHERRLRFYILKNLSSKIDLLKFHDLVNSLVSLNKMDFNDANGIEFTYVKNLGTKMLENTTELEEKSIFQFLKGDHNNQHPIFFKIYQEFVKNTYSEIEQTGKTEFDSKVVLRLLSHLSSHYSFNRHSQIQKKKFYNFLKKTAKQFTLANDNQGIKLLLSSLQDLVKNRYFEQSKSSELVEVVLISNQPIRLSLLQALFNNKIDIEKVLQKFFNGFSPQSIGLAGAIKISTLLKRIGKSEKYEAFQSSIESGLLAATKKISEVFDGPQKFSQNFLSIFRNSSNAINFRFFNDTHQEYFQRLINPFQGDQSTSTFQYKLAYLQYVVHSLRPNKFYKFIGNYAQKIDYAIVVKVINSNVSQDSRKVQPSKYITTLILKKLNSALQSKQKQFLSSTIQLLSKYNRFVVSANRDYQLAKNVIRIINVCLSKTQVLKECELDKTFFNQFSKYIVRSTGNYQNEEILRDIVGHGLKLLDNLPTYLVIQVLRQGVRLNIVEKQHIKNLDLSKYTGFNYSEKFTLQYIQNSTYVPQIKNIKAGFLQTILFNHNLNSLIEQREAEINQIIEKAYTNDLFSYLASINQPRTRATNKIVTKIVGQIVASGNNIQRSDFQGAIKNLIERGYTNTRGCKELAEKIVNFLSYKISHFSIWTHTEAIRFAISIPTYNPREYYNKLLQYTEKNFNDSDVEQVLYRLSSTNYEFKPKDLRYVKSLLRRSAYKATYFFLATENLHSEAEKKQIVTELANRLSEPRNHQISINSVQYGYLKRAYPQETKNLNLQAQKLQKPMYTVKLRSKYIELLEQVAKATQTSVQSLPDLQQLHITKVNNVCILLLNQRRIGSFHEHEFLKRALSLHYKQQGYQFVFLGYAKINKMVDAIQKQVPQFITPEAKQAITQYLQKNKPQREEEVNDESKPIGEKSQNQQRVRKPRQNKKAESD